MAGHRLWVTDHLIQADPTSSPDSEMLEAYTTLGFLAAHTERLRLGTMVTGGAWSGSARLSNSRAGCGGATPHR